MLYDSILGEILLDAVSAGTGSQSGGRRLEELVAYLFWTSGEYDVTLNTRGLDAEIDLRLRASTGAAAGSRGRSPHAELGSYVLVECKNTTRPANAATVKKFATDVRLTNCRCGVLVSVAGVTGGSGSRNRDGVYTVRKLFHADGTVVIVLDAKHLRAIVEERVTMIDALLERYEAIRFDLPPF